MVEIVCAIIFGVIALGSLIISVRQFQEKGFLFNNAYIWATKQQRAAMDKRPHYRQSAIVFGLMAAACSVMAVEFILATGWLWILVGALAIAILAYAIVSSVKEGK